MKKPGLIIRQPIMTNAELLPVKQRAFSLVEVVVALGIFATAIIVIVGLLAANTQATSRTIEAETAARLADTIRTELQRYGYDNVAAGVTAAVPRVFLVATRDGSRVLPTNEDSEGNDGGRPALLAEGNLETATTPGNPPGIAQRDRYFHVSVRRLVPNPAGATKLTSPTAATAADEAVFPVVIEVTWPHRTPNGPSAATTTTDYDDEASTVTPEQQREIFKLTAAIVR